MSRDMMPSFELYQPDSLEGALKLSKDLDKDGWLLAGGQDSYDWFKDRAKRPGALDRSHRHRGAQGHPRNRRGPRGRRAHHAHRDRRERSGEVEVHRAGARRRACRQSADPQCRHAGRQSLPGRALLVLPRRRRLLPRRRQYLLRGHAAGPEPRTLFVWRVALHRGVAVGHRAGSRGARGQHRDLAARRANARCRPRSFSSARRWTSRA